MDHRYDFVFLFDVTDGNPNGDPDAGNLPRVDPETGHGLVTDVCLKRKVRNFISMSHPKDEGLEIFVKEKSTLNETIDDGYVKAGLDPDAAKKAEGKKDKSKERRANIETARSTMCKLFYDVRAFGAVLSTGANAGQVRGPIQLTFSRSICPIVSLEHSLTRVAVTSEKDAEKKETEMGRKFTVPYGMYRCHGFVNPFFAKQTGFSADDLELFWKSLHNMFELDRSASRGQMTPQSLVVFEHADALGNAPAHLLQKRVTVKRKAVDSPARSSDDYEVAVDETDLPAGITVHRMF
ncbi:MAG: type I-C CRISPR-associated protein Cas7/Csd2 [Rubripirellula sp.]